MRDPLERLCHRMDGAAIAAAVVRSDGTLVDAVRAAPSEDAARDEAWSGFGDILEQMQNSAQMLAAGALQELLLSSSHGLTIIRPLLPDLFLALSVSPHASTGKARYLCRVTAPLLIEAM